MERPIELEDLVRQLDFKNKAEMLLASREELEKCKTKNTDISEQSINQIYAQAAILQGVAPKTAYDEVVAQIASVKYFKTGNQE